MLWTNGVAAITVFCCLTLTACRSDSKGTDREEPDENRAVAVALTLYPDDEFARALFAQVIATIELHKTVDPYGGAPGPGVVPFGMDRMPLAFYVNVANDKTDLLVFNMDRPELAAFVEGEPVAALSKKPIYRIKDVSLSQLATQTVDDVEGGELITKSFFCPINNFRSK